MSYAGKVVVAKDATGLDGGAVEQRRIERLGGAGSTNSRAEINVGLFQLTVTSRKLSTIFASKLEVRAERDS